MIHHVSESNIYTLESIFAEFTPEGWKIPDWLVLMRETMKEKK